MKKYCYEIRYASSNLTDVLNWQDIICKGFGIKVMKINHDLPGPEYRWESYAIVAGNRFATALLAFRLRKYYTKDLMKNMWKALRTR